MPPSKSSKGKAAWERARRYADEHNVSVKEARSILARQTSDEKDEPPPQPTRPHGRAASKRRPANPTKGKPTDLSAAEAALRKKYPHIIEGSIKAHEDGPHKGRRTVEIVCQNKGCQNTRTIHTSDAFQVELCTDCTKLLRQQKRAKAAKKGTK
jgi:hypothetical protein